MNVTVNEQPVEIGEHSSIETLLIHLDKPLDGTAVAINQTVIHRTEWREYQLAEGMRISLFQAIAGG